MTRKTASINVRVPQSIKGVVGSRTSRAGVSESDFVRSAILHCATLPDDKFEEFIDKKVIHPSLKPLEEHFQQELEIQQLCANAVRVLSLIAFRKNLLGMEKEVAEVAKFFNNINLDIQRQRMCDEQGTPFSSRFTKDG